MAAASASIALSCPKITSFRLRSRLRRISRSDSDTFFAGMRAMRATTSSMWRTSTVGSRSAIGFRRARAPASSTTSMALSGRWRSLMWRCGELRRGAQRVVGVGDAVVLLEARLQAEQDLDGLGDRRLDHVDLLEAPCERVVLFENAAVFVVGRGTDAADLAVGEHRLDEVRGVHHAAGSGTGADDGVDLIDEENRPGLLLQLRDHALQALLEIAAILGAGDERAHVEGENRAVGEHLRHLALDDEPRKTFRDRGLADAGFPDVEGIVLAAAAQDLDRALDLELAADQRIDTPILGRGDSGWWCTSRARCRPRRRARRRPPFLPYPCRTCRRRSWRGRARCSSPRRGASRARGSAGTPRGFASR